MESESQPRGGVGREYVKIAEGLPVPSEVDWTDAPGAFKRYTGLPRLPLDYETAEASAAKTPGHRLEFEQIGQLLSDAYGLTRQRWMAPEALWRVLGTRKTGATSEHIPVAANTLRPVASGGARFPGELYVVSGPGQDIPTGVHHYDPAHHALVTLRTGDWTPRLAAALAVTDQRPSLTILVSIFFWKNAFKYGELSYRLCGLDAGALSGQILTVSGRYAPRVGLRCQFLDDDLNDLAQLDPSRESVFAAISISADDSSPAPDERASPAGNSPPIPRTGSSKTEESWSIESLPLLARLHRGSRLTTAESFQSREVVADPATAGVAAHQAVSLPEHDMDLLGGLRRRRSSTGYFRPYTLSQHELAGLLRAATGGYHSDLGDSARQVRHTVLFCAINNVRGIASGVYYYEADEHALRQVRAGDVRDELQATLMVTLFNLAHTSLCLYPVGNYENGFETHGDRWYRMQNMAAGVVTQRLYLAAAALGLDCRANLGYNVSQTNSLLGLDRGPLTSLLQILVGAGREPGHYYEHTCA